MKHFFIHISSLFISFPIIGQNSISGIISDKLTTETLPGINVYIPELQKGTITDANGNYELLDLPNGSFKVKIPIDI